MPGSLGFWLWRFDLRYKRNRIFPKPRPKDGVAQHALKGSKLKILRVAERGVKHPATAIELAHPTHRLPFLSSLEMSMQQNARICTHVAVAIKMRDGNKPLTFESRQDGMGSMFFNVINDRRWVVGWLVTVMPLIIAPQDFLIKILPAHVPLIGRVTVKGMTGSANAYDTSTALEKGTKMVHLFRRRGPPPDTDDADIGIFQSLQPRKIVWIIFRNEDKSGVNQCRIDGRLNKSWQGASRLILLLSNHENDPNGIGRFLS